MDETATVTTEKPDPAAQTKAILQSIEQWRKRAIRYYQRAETEKDPIGQKFFESSATAYANCYWEIRDLLGLRPDPVEEEKVFQEFLAGPRFQALLKKFNLPDPRNRLEAQSD